MLESTDLYIIKVPGVPLGQGPCQKFAFTMYSTTVKDVRMPYLIPVFVSITRGFIVWKNVKHKIIIFMMQFHI